MNWRHVLSMPIVEAPEVLPGSGAFAFFAKPDGSVFYLKGGMFTSDESLHLKMVRRWKEFFPGVSEQQIDKMIQEAVESERIPTPILQAAIRGRYEDGSFYFEVHHNLPLTRSEAQVIDNIIAQRSQFQEVLVNAGRRNIKITSDEYANSNSSIQEALSGQ